MTTQTKNRPARTLQDGALKASLWKNHSKNGAFYSVTFSRTYRDDNGNYHDSSSFSGTDLLKLSRLAARAYEDTQALREQTLMGQEGGAS